MNWYTFKRWIGPFMLTGLGVGALVGALQLRADVVDQAGHIATAPVNPSYPTSTVTSVSVTTLVRVPPAKVVRDEHIVVLTPSTVTKTVPVPGPPSVVVVTKTVQAPPERTGAVMQADMELRGKNAK